MSALNFRTKPSVPDSAQDLNDDAFDWASQNIGGRDAVEEFMSCGVWLLFAGVNFVHVKVDLCHTPVLKEQNQSLYTCAQDVQMTRIATI
jgi:hypothetical protein